MESSKNTYQERNISLKWEEIWDSGLTRNIIAHQRWKVLDRTMLYRDTIMELRLKKTLRRNFVK